MRVFGVIPVMGMISVQDGLPASALGKAILAWGPGVWDAAIIVAASHLGLPYNMLEPLCTFLATTIYMYTLFFTLKAIITLTKPSHDPSSFGPWRSKSLGSQVVGVTSRHEICHGAFDIVEFCFPSMLLLLI